MFRITGKTHPGAVREHNEDAFYCSDGEGVAVVADGMGGYAAGEVASEIIVRTVAELKPAADRLVATLVECHNRIVAHARENPESKGMGSAVVLSKLASEKVAVCWAGDSRAYLYTREGQLKAVSRDHSYVQWLLSQGQISETEARNHPERNLVTQCLGLQAPQPELTTVGWRSGDILLLCSDGLTDELTDREIRDLLANSTSPQAALEDLIEAALKAGGKDNITVMLAENLSPSAPVQQIGNQAEVSGSAPAVLLPILFGIAMAALLVGVSLFLYLQG